MFTLFILYVAPNTTCTRVDFVDVQNLSTGHQIQALPYTLRHTEFEFGVRKVCLESCDSGLGYVVVNY